MHGREGALNKLTISPICYERRERVRARGHVCIVHVHREACIINACAVYARSRPVVSGISRSAAPCTFIFHRDNLNARAIKQTPLGRGSQRLSESLCPVVPLTNGLGRVPCAFILFALLPFAILTFLVPYGPSTERSARSMLSK